MQAVDAISKTNTMQEVGNMEDDLMLDVLDLLNDGINSQEGSQTSVDDVRPTNGDASANSKVAIKSKRARLRRKRERMALMENIAHLERENAGHRKTIALLQQEIQARRDLGQVDLRMENNLLRREILNYRHFVHMFKRFKDDGSWPEDEALGKARILNRGVMSAFGTCISMCYSSVVDPSWKDAKMTTDNPVMNSSFRVKYQLLPIGSTFETAKRWNIRVDALPSSAPAPAAFGDRKFALSNVSDNYFSLHSGGKDGSEYLKQSIKALEDTYGCSMKLKMSQLGTYKLVESDGETNENSELFLHDAEYDSQTHESGYDLVRTMRYEQCWKMEDNSGEKETTNDSLAITAYRKGYSLSNSFFPALDASCERKQVKANIIATVTSHSLKQIEDLPEQENVGALFVKGGFFTLTENNEILGTRIGSFPLEEDGAGFIGSRACDLKRLFASETELSKEHSDMLVATHQLLFQPVKQT